MSLTNAWKYVPNEKKMDGNGLKTKKNKKTITHKRKRILKFTKIVLIKWIFYQLIVKYN